jgi:hypothetical protein
MIELKLSNEFLWKEIQKTFGEKGGAYQLVSRKKGEIVHIPRFLGLDRNGVLYIGKATSYLKRVIDLKKTMSMNSSAHICGRRYKKHDKMKALFPFETLYIQLIQDDSPEEKEKELLNTYVREFGEVPPLNANG